MRPVLAVIGMAAASLVLNGCSPVVDAEFHNATGQPIVVTNRGDPAFQSQIPVGGSAALDIFVSRSPHRPEFSISSPGHVWVYRSRSLSGLEWDYWEGRPFEAKRLHVSIDRRGKIHLLSPSGAPVNQPRGFPVTPEKT